MNDAARSTRAIDAPILKDFAPHSAGSGSDSGAVVAVTTRAVVGEELVPSAGVAEQLGHRGESLAAHVLAGRHALRYVGEIRDDVLHLAAVDGSFDPEMLRVKQ